MREREILRILGNASPYMVHLYSSFQDSQRLYFVLTYAKNGELLKHIQTHTKFNFECTRWVLKQKSIYNNVQLCLVSSKMIVNPFGNLKKMS